MATEYAYTFDSTLNLASSSPAGSAASSIRVSGTFTVDYGAAYSYNQLKSYDIYVNGEKLQNGIFNQSTNLNGVVTSQPAFYTSSGGGASGTYLYLYYNGQQPSTFVNAEVNLNRTDYSVYPVASQYATFRAQQVAVTSTPVCFVTGTRIRTKRGEIAVEDLQIGDLAVTASRAQLPIRWIGHRLVEASDHAAPQDVWPVRITAGALAMGVPVRDLLVSPDHCLVFDDVLVPAKHLINGATIRQEPVEAVGYWHIELDSHETLLAEGAPAESYRDCGMHAFFEGAEGWGHRVGDKAPVALLAPHALSGPRLHGVKAILIARAKHLGARRVEDPGLQVVADGQVLTPASIDNRRFTFAVPEGTQTLVLRSRSSVPAHWIAENEDRRRLGVRVSELRVDGTAVAMADAQLAQGWNAVEPNGQERWTEGSAHLPVCRELSFQADWFLGYPVETVSEPMPVNVGESFAAPVLRLVANG